MSNNNKNSNNALPDEIPDEFVVKHGLNAADREYLDHNSSGNNSLNGKIEKRYSNMIKKERGNVKVSIEEDIKKRYSEIIKEFKDAMKNAPFNKEKKMDVAKNLLKALKQKVVLCEGAIKSLKEPVQYVGFEGLIVSSDLGLNISYKYPNPDPESLIPSAEKNDFDQILNFVLYILYRSNLEEFKKKVEEWNLDEKTNSTEWPEEIRFWQYWCKLAYQLLQSRVDLEKYKNDSGVKKLEMGKYDFALVNQPIKAKEGKFSGNEREDKGSDRRGDRRDDRKDNRRGKGQRGGGKKGKRKSSDPFSSAISRQNRQQRKKGKGQQKGKKGQKGRKIVEGKGRSLNSDPNSEPYKLFRIMSNGVEDKGGSGDEIKGSIWNDICNKMRKKIENILLEKAKNFENFENSDIIQINDKDNKHNLWLFYLTNKNNLIDLILNNAIKLQNDKDIKDKIKEAIKNINWDNDNFGQKIHNNRENIANKLSSWYSKKLAQFKGKKNKNHNFVNNVSIKLTNPFTGQIYDKSSEIVNRYGDNPEKVAKNYLKFFNPFAINDINNDNGGVDDMYKKTRNKLFVGLIEYYSTTIKVINQVMNDLRYDYNISESETGTETETKTSAEDMNSNVSENNVSNTGKNKMNKVNRVRKKRGLLNSGNDLAMKNAKIVIDIDNKIRQIINKAQNDQNYEFLGKIDQFLNKYENKLREMDPEKAHMILNKIRK